MEQIVSLQGGVSPLLAPEDEVNPEMQVLRHVVALKGLAVLLDEVLRGRGPRRQNHVVNRVRVMPPPQGKAVPVP
jgi:hypothetical protein